MEDYRKVRLLDNDILLAAIIENANQLGVHSKKPMAPQNEQRFKVPGEVDYLVSFSRHLDNLLFPMSIDRKLRVMATVNRPYDYEDIVEKAQNHLNGMKD